MSTEDLREVPELGYRGFEGDFSFDINKEALIPPRELEKMPSGTGATVWPFSHFLVLLL